MKSKIGTIFKGILPMIIGIGIQLVVAMAASFVASFIVGFKMGLQGEFDVTQIQASLLAVTSSPIFMDTLTITAMTIELIVIGIWYFKTKPTRQFAKLRESLHPVNILIILVCGLALQISCSMGLTVILPLFPKVMNDYTALINSIVGGNIVIAFINTVILAPFVEEFIFRGLATRQFQKLLPFWAANLIQALLFGIYHLNIVQGVYAFLLGIVFGLAARRCKSIWASVLLHAAVNCSGLFLDVILPESLGENIPAVIILFVICAIIVFALQFLYRVPALPDFAMNNGAGNGYNYGDTFSSQNFTGPRYDDLSQYPVSSPRDYYQNPAYPQDNLPQQPEAPAEPASESADTNQ